MIKISFLRIWIPTVILVNVIGLTLRYFELDTYLIVLGFRFHLSFVLPLLIIYPRNYFSSVKIFFLNPSFKRKFLPLLWIIFPLAIILSALFILNKIQLGDPEYFYEFGLSSIFDYPVYLIWNFPQFILLFSFLVFSISNYKNKFFPVLLIIIFLFAYELIPADFKIDLNKINFIPCAELFISAIAVGLFFQFYENVYWFAVVFFSIFWSNLLAFGSGSETMVNILFASQYRNWEGFFSVSKEFYPYLLSAQIFFLLIFFLINISYRTKKEQQI